MDDDYDSNLKCSINTLVWTWASGDMTLDRAEQLACDIFNLFEEANIQDSEQ